MGAETFVCYWIGQEPCPPSPTLDQMPAYVDVAPLAFATIDANYQLSFDFLCTHFPAQTIQGWVREVRANGTKVLLSIIGKELGTVPDVEAFTSNVAEHAKAWDVDGIDLDFEPPTQSETVIQVAAALRPKLQRALGREPMIAAPIYGPWAWMPDFLKRFAAELDLVTTMDYTPWNGAESMEEQFEQYASIVGSPEKIAIGVSCMDSSGTGNFTPLDDVKAICRWEPSAGRKGGAMLYTFSYDLESRIVNGKQSGTGYPDGTWTQTIHDCLP
jgi:hypothetical protein